MATSRYELNIIQDSNSGDSRPTGDSLVISSHDNIIEFKISSEDRVICVSKKEMAWLVNAFSFSYEVEQSGTKEWEIDPYGVANR